MVCRPGETPRIARALCAMVLVAWAVSDRPAAAQPASESVVRTLRGEAPRPRLVVVLSIDQFRADYLTRYADLFLKPIQNNGQVGGFRYLMSHGAWFPDARYEHFPLFTGPGHAVILTGGHPYKHGIVGNDWWDAAAKKWVYCVDDPRWTVVGKALASQAKPMGPANLRSSTVGDELKLATAGRAKVVTLSLKDRAAILLGGHAQDLSIWFDDTGGRWISSTAYCRGEHLPAWVEAVNDQQIPTKALGTEWKPTVAADVLESRTFVPAIADVGPYKMGRTFPHRIGAAPETANYRAFTLTPGANEFVFATAKRAVTEAGLGAEDTPDLLAINLATNDYAGHAWGPYSPELLDITVKTDEQLADFLNFLDRTVGGGLKDGVVFALTADHGVAPVPEDALKSPPFGLPAGRVPEEAVVAAVEQALDERYGRPEAGTWFSEDPAAFVKDLTTGKDKRDLKLKKSGAFVEGFVYLNPDAVAGVLKAGKARDWREVEAAASDGVTRARIPGVYACYGKRQLLRGEVADNDIGRRLARAIQPTLSGDLLVVPEQMHLFGAASGEYATTHGTPYAYDTHVPVVLAGPGVRPGVYLDPIAPSDLAPTLSLLLGVEYPSGCDGRPLRAALK